MIEAVGLQRVWAGRTLMSVPRWALPAQAHCCVTGPSGSGKSSLLEVLCALRPPTQGQLLVDGVDVTALRGRAADRWRGRSVGAVTQAPHFLDVLSVQENVALGARFSGCVVEPGRASALLDRLGIGHVAQRRPAQLSQGERQRVALARALLTRPRLVVADEPTSHLDDDTCAALCDLLMACCRESEATLVVATHDQRIVPRFSHRLDMQASGAGTTRCVS